MKTCTGCKQAKPVDQFWRDRRAGDGRVTRCTSCIREYRAVNADKIKPVYHAYRQANLDRIRARDKQAARDNPGRRHNLTAKEYAELSASQGDVCAVCRQPETRVSRHGTLMRLSVDHDHTCCPGETSCGKCIRGLLCGACNIAAGKLREDPDLALALAMYMLRGKNVLGVSACPGVPIT